MKNKKHFRDVVAVVESFFPDNTVEARGGHIHIEVKHNGLSKKITASSTPSCRHATNQLRRDMRRIKEQLTEGVINVS